MVSTKFKHSLVFFILAVILPIPTIANIFDELLMPGPVVQAHVEFERKCDTCHTKLDRDQQNKLCTDCHDHNDIAKDVVSGQGFHGMNPAVKGERCSHCHSDHKGREARVVLFNPEAFRHQYADFELVDRHKDVECSSCHPKDRKYSNTPNLCIDCHKDVDPHLGRLGEKCRDCHKESGWRDNAFDHERDTKFKLDGKHVEAGCKLCHAGERYKKTPKVCVACHLINDSHGGRYGKECEKCHTAEAWKESRFDHSTETKFKLTGRHQKAICNSCHRGNLFDDKLNMACVSCHKLDDEHKGKNGKVCQECHDSKSWANVRFRHDKDTKFPLKGKHEGLACESCHRESTAVENPKPDCVECHRDDDVHNEQEGLRCEKCHNESGWGVRVFFDHDLVRFPLIGQHSAVTCEECHLSPAYQDTEISCFACHEKKDIHDKTFGRKCHDCHNPNGWDFWSFDHDQQTEFSLEGKHDGLSCNACHSVPLPEGEKRETSCFACHYLDDRHRGEFGRQCKRCHQPSSFADVTYPR